MKKEKFSYTKMTFLLSVIGFFGSIGFYLGVLRQVYSSSTGSQDTIQELQIENKRLKEQINILIEEKHND
ncbi:MAG: hypothetical protein COA32_13585 [Fluviicola sp.]|nr:MAG: hypothetical protein COA32_13585 [Fluviicola sp.]